MTFEAQLLSYNHYGNEGHGSVADKEEAIRIVHDRELQKPDLSSGLGWQEFITLDQLRSTSFNHSHNKNYYIYNRVFKIRAHLSAKSFERIADC